MVGLLVQVVHGKCKIDKGLSRALESQIAGLSAVCKSKLVHESPNMQVRDCLGPCLRLLEVKEAACTSSLTMPMALAVSWAMTPMGPTWEPGPSPIAAASSES